LIDVNLACIMDLLADLDYIIFHFSIQMLHWKHMYLLHHKVWNLHVINF